MKILNGVAREQIPVTVKDQDGKIVLNNESIDPWGYIEKNLTTYTVSLGDGNGKTWGPFSDPQGIVFIGEYITDKEGHLKNYVVLCKEQSI